MLEYSNLSDRPPSRFIRIARRLLPGVDAVEQEIRPYAQAWHERNLDALASSDPLWVVLGDSLSQGIGASSVEQSWVLQTWRALAAHRRRYRVVNLSVSGARVDDVVRRQIPAIAGLAATPALVTVLVGSNDIIKHDLRAQLPENYRRLLTALPVGSLVATVPSTRGVQAEVNRIDRCGAGRRDGRGGAAALRRRRARPGPLPPERHRLRSHRRQLHRSNHRPPGLGDPSRPRSTPMDLSGSTALVTGANRGLGRRFAEELLRRGAKVYAGARNPDDVRTEGVLAVALDVTRAESVAAAVAATGDVTLLINNAGSFTSTDLLTGDLDQIELEMNTHYFGTLGVTRALAPQLARNGGGAVLNVLSVLSWLAVPADGAYCAAKSAEWALTNALRAQLAPQGTSVTALHVGYMDTDMSRDVQAPKSDPAVVAALSLDAVERGDPEILADDITRQVQAGLAGGVARLYPA